MSVEARSVGHQMLSTDLLHPNEYNPNEMTEGEFVPQDVERLSPRARQTCVPQAIRMTESRASTSLYWSLRETQFVADARNGTDMMLQQEQERRRSRRQKFVFGRRAIRRLAAEKGEP